MIIKTAVAAVTEGEVEVEKEEEEGVYNDDDGDGNNNDEKGEANQSPKKEEEKKRGIILLQGWYGHDHSQTCGSSNRRDTQHIQQAPKFAFN